jgi:hypothetical protein
MLGESRQRSLSRVWVYHSTFQVTVEARSVRSVTKPPTGIRVHADYGPRRRMPFAADVHGHFDLAEWDPSWRGRVPLCFHAFAVNYFEALKCSTSY